MTYNLVVETQFSSRHLVSLSIFFYVVDREIFRNLRKVGQLFPFVLASYATWEGPKFVAGRVGSGHSEERARSHARLTVKPEASQQVCSPKLESHFSDAGNLHTFPHLSATS